MIEIVIQKDGREEADLQGSRGIDLLDDLPRGKTTFVGIGPDEVEVELVESSLGEEVGAGGKGFQVEELVLDEAMDSFDIALVGVGGRGDADVLAVAESGGEAVALGPSAFPADELAAVVGLPDQVAQGDAGMVQVALTAARSCFFWYLRRRGRSSPCSRRMRWMAMWLSGRSNSRRRRWAPKVGNRRRRATTC